MLWQIVWSVWKRMTLLVTNQMFLSKRFIVWKFFINFFILLISLQTHFCWFPNLNSHLSSSIRKVLMLWISDVSVCSGLNLMFLSKKWHSFQRSSLFISILGWGFLQGAEGGGEGRDRLSLPWCRKKKCEVVVMHIARQWFFILLQKKTNSRRPD